MEESGGSPENHKDIFVFFSEINRMLLEVTEGYEELTNLHGKKSDHRLMRHLVALLLIPDALTAVSNEALLVRANQINLFWSAAMYPSGKVELLSVNTGSSWTKCTGS